MATTVLPLPETLPDVLPAARLTAAGRPAQAFREELRHIPDARNVVTVIGALAQSFGVIAVAAAIGHPVAWVAAFFLVGRGFVLLNILSHEAVHRLLFTSRRLNDVVGRWIVGYPAFVPFELYRRGHMAHHRDELGPDEPDLGLYSGYPVTRASLRRKLTRDASFVSGWKILKGLLRGLRKPATRPVAMRIVLVQVALATAFTALGRPELYVLLWFAPWMTVWRVLNRLRAIAEHAGMKRSADRRETTHVVRQSAWARFWMVPYNTGFHLAHHVDSGIPFRSLPRLHRELEASGWVTPGIVYPSYRALWRALASG